MTCNFCGGSGVIRSADGAFWPCPRCKQQTKERDAGLEAAHDAWQEATGWRANRNELMPVLKKAIDAYLNATGLDA